MKLYLRRQAIIAWLLLFTIAPMGIVKSFHTHEKGESSAAHHCSDSSCDCAICQFHILPFIETSVFHLKVHQIVRPCETVARIFKVRKVALYSYSLRAPPYLF
jgi:hypothetical protein